MTATGKEESMHLSKPLLLRREDGYVERVGVWGGGVGLGGGGGVFKDRL